MGQHGLDNLSLVADTRQCYRAVARDLAHQQLAIPVLTRTKVSEEPVGAAARNLHIRLEQGTLHRPVAVHLTRRYRLLQTHKLDLRNVASSETPQMLQTEEPEPEPGPGELVASHSRGHLRVTGHAQAEDTETASAVEMPSPARYTSCTMIDRFAFH